MRILYQSDGYLPDVIGGVEVFSELLIGELRARGHEILVLTSCIGHQPAGWYRHGDTAIMKFNFGEALLSNRLDAIRRLQQKVNAVVTDFQPDMLHINDARASSFFLVRRGDLRDIPRLLTLHSPIRPTHKGALLNRLADDADSVIAVSHFVAVSAMTDIPNVRGKIGVIANAMPLPFEQLEPLPVQPPLLLCVGRVIEDKGMGTAIEALAMLRDRHLAARLAIVGDGPNLAALRDLVATRGLLDLVDFHGWMMPQDISSMINRASIVLVPSIWEEAFGLVALQAAQMARPVIASRVGGLPEVVEDGKSGLLVPPNDPARLAEAIARLIVDPALAIQMGDYSRERCVRSYDFTRFVNAYESAYEAARISRAMAAVR